MHRKTSFLVGCVAVVLAAGICVPAGNAAEQEPEGLTVAVFNFETRGKEVADLGEKVGDLLTVFLSTEEGLQLVERTRIKQILEEMELGASGIVDTDRAARIGGMLGAQVLVVGRGFIVNEKLYLTGKAISVETSRVNAQLAKGGLDEDLDVIVQDLSMKMSEWLRDNASKMVAKIQTPADQVDKLRKALGDKDLPKIGTVVVERHVGQQTVDPAAETEIMYLLRKVGVIVVSGKNLRLSDWAKEFIEDADIKLPPTAARKADVIIMGEGFSEFAGRKGNLISVKARLELRAIDTKLNRILSVSRKTVTQVDLAEQIAGKTALQKAAGEAVVEMMPEIVDQWNKLRKEEAKD